MDELCARAPLNFARPASALAFEDYEALVEVLRNNEAAFAKKKLAVFGAGMRGSIFAYILERHGYHDFIFVDNNPQKWGHVINSHAILSPDAITANFADYIVIISIEDSADVAAQLRAAGFVEGRSFFDARTNIYTNYAREFVNKTSAKYLVMGDCFFSHVSIYDENTASLGGLLKDRIGPDRVKLLAMHGMNMLGFYHVFKEQLRLGMEFETLVLEIAFSPFNPRHSIMPHSQHAALFELLKNSLESPSVEFVDYVNLTSERSKKLMVNVFSQSNPDSLGLRDNAKLVMQMTYMFKFRADIENIKYMEKIFELANNNNINMLLFIPPVNYMLGERLFGARFAERYQGNLQSIKHVLYACGANDFLDLSYLLEDTYFTDTTMPEELSGYAGRALVLDKLADFIEKTS